MPKPKLKQFCGRVTVIYGQFENTDLFLVEAKDEAEANSIVETIIKADNLETNGLDGNGFSWFAHGTDETGVKDNFSLTRITPEQAKVLSEIARVSYVNDGLADAKAAIKAAETETEDA